MGSFGKIVALTEACAEESATEVAVIVTVAGLGTTGGAM
jgi:hypothetical protein